MIEFFLIVIYGCEYLFYLSCYLFFFWWVIMLNKCFFKNDKGIVYN